LRADPRVQELSHFGGLLRVVTGGGGDPTAIVGEALRARELTARELRETNVTVEDAFVAMVRQDERRAARAAAGERQP
jgi:hypothetical protein